MSANAIEFWNIDAPMRDCPIRPHWLLEGKPVCRNSVLSTSADGTTTILLWDCTPGRFNWFYDVEETLYVLEGSVLIKNESGVTRRVGAGDVVFFPAGSRAEWTVETFIRKVAICRIPLTNTEVFFRKVKRRLLRLVGRDPNQGSGPAMFQS